MWNVLFGNRSRFPFSLMSALLLCVSLTYPANAGTTVTFATQGDYTSAVGTELFLVDFNGITNTTVNGNIIDSNIIFSSPEASNPSLVLWSSNALSDAGSATAPNNVGPIEGVFIAPVQAFSFSFVGASVSETVLLYDSSDTLIDTLTAPNALGFFGATSTTPIARFRIYPGEKNGLRERVFIDDLQANAIPEPATFSIISFASVFLLRRK